MLLAITLMKCLRPYMLLAAFLLSMSTGFAQSSGKPASEASLVQAHTFSNIFSGRDAEPYPNTFTGSYYLYSSQFIEGSLYYGGKYYNKVDLNINAQKEDLHILSPDKSYAVILDPALVSGLKIGERDFVYYARDNQWGLPMGYYEIVRDTPLCLLKHIRKRYRESVDMLERTMQKYFEPVEQYYLIKAGAIFPLTGRKSLLKVLGDHRKALSRWGPQRAISVKENPEGFYTLCIDYYVSLLKQD